MICKNFSTYIQLNKVQESPPLLTALMPWGLIGFSLVFIPSLLLQDICQCQ